ncbi:GntR family transcriptional regulator [Streptomyces sp. L7]|uniref:GntR family transcriptional regulator n=1 Tax=Streptomyces sp. L7 TaxID=3423954 RepID=UPI003D9775AF
MPEQPHVYDRLRSAILDLDRVPGSRITERGLEAELGASRTPLRAALMRLEAEGLVRRDGRGWEVSPSTSARSPGSASCATPWRAPPYG